MALIGNFPGVRSDFDDHEYDYCDDPLYDDERRDESPSPPGCNSEV